MRLLKRKNKREIMNKKLIFLILIIVLSVLVFPVYENYHVEQIIAQKKAVLRTDGINLDIKSKEGYFVSTKKFDLRFQNGQAIADAMKEKLIAFNPLYQNKIEAYFKKNQTAIAKALEGIRFSGFITVNNLMISKPKMQLALKELPTILMQNIKNKPSASSTILPWLKQGLISFKVVFKRNGSLERIMMKNFDEKFTSGIKKRKSHIKLLGNQLIILSKNSGEYQMKNTSIQSKNPANNKMLLMQLKGLKYKYKYDDMLHQSANMKLGHFAIKMDEKRYSTNFLLDNFVINSATDSNNKKTKLIADYKIGKIDFSAYKQLLKLDKFNIKFIFNDLDTPAIKSFINTYEKKIVPGQHYPSILNSNMSTIINKGFNLEVDGGINSVKYSIFSLKAFDFTMNLRIAPNSLTKYSKPTEAERFVSITTNIRVAQNDIDQLSVMNPRLVNILKKYAKKDGDHVLFHVVLKKSKLSINGKDL